MKTTEVYCNVNNFTTTEIVMKSTVYNNYGIIITYHGNVNIIEVLP